MCLIKVVEHIGSLHDGDASFQQRDGPAGALNLLNRLVAEPGCPQEVVLQGTNREGRSRVPLSLPPPRDRARVRPAG